MAHAYVVTGNREEATERARGFAARRISSDASEPDITELAFGLLSVDDAAVVANALYQSAVGTQKVVIVYASRLFHEAQNALLKAVEEPAEGSIFILGVPSHGILLPTLRSRLSPLETGDLAAGEHRGLQRAHEFIALTPAEREKYVAKLIDRTKSDADATKQEARSEAAELVRGLIEAFYTVFHTLPAGSERDAYRAFLDDLSAFLPRMYERSAPLKLMFEHILRVIPIAPKKARV